MKRYARPLILLASFVVLAALVLATFSFTMLPGSPMPSSSNPGYPPAPGYAPEAMATTAPAASEAPGVAGRTDSEAYGGTTANAPQAQVQSLDRKIIKDANFVIDVESLDNAITQLSTLAVQSGGYVLQTSTNSGNGYGRSANIQFAVPVERFEESLQRVRETAKEVLSEGSSGVDVTQEFVDTQSQIDNLEATRLRVREFLGQTKNVEEALAVNQELSRLEGELGLLKGRIQYLSQRSSFSTVTVEARQPLPPSEVVQRGWQPGEVIEEAFGSLIGLLQGLATFVIWLVIVVLPVLLPLGLVLWLVARRFRRNKPVAS